MVLKNVFLSYSRDLTTTRVCSEMVLKSDIRGLCWAGAEGSEGAVAEGFDPRGGSRKAPRRSNIS